MECNGMAALFLQGPTNSSPMVLLAWGCGMGEVLGPWLAVKSHLLGLWAQKGPMRSHLCKVQPVLVTPFYCIAQGVGCVSCHIAPCLYLRETRALAPVHGNTRLTNTNSCKSPSVAKKSLSPAQRLFLHLSAIQQMLGMCIRHYNVWGNTVSLNSHSLLTWNLKLPDFW